MYAATSGRRSSVFDAICQKPPITPTSRLLQNASEFKWPAIAKIVRAAGRNCTARRQCWSSERDLFARVYKCRPQSRRHTFRTRPFGFAVNQGSLFANPSECSSALCNCVNARRDITLLPLKFLFHNFRYFFTLFSKFFSYFLHSTFSLSIFKQYLELREIYHAFCTVISNSATLRRLSGVCSPARLIADRYKIITFSDSTFQSLFWITVDATGSSQADSVLNYNSIGSICPDSTESKSPFVIDLKFVLFLFHSPLLKKSLLFSFPTLN